MDLGPDKTSQNFQVHPRQTNANLDYRTILKQELAHRCNQNPNYSLRAFARDLKLAPSRLSEILNKKQGLSRKAAEKIASLLGFASRGREMFCDLVASIHSRSKRDREIAKLRLLRNKLPEDDFFHLQLDTFKIIADWYHLGILELVQIKGFTENHRWIAKKLGITAIQAELAIGRLLRLQLLVRREGKLQVRQYTGYLQDEIPSENIKKFHRQILAKAMNALILQSEKEREFTVNILAISESDMEYAREQISLFQRNFCAKLKKKKPKESLYCLSVQFFNLFENNR